MSDRSEEQEPPRDAASTSGDAASGDAASDDAASGASAGGAAAGGAADDASLDELRRHVEEKYDFDRFTPEQMAAMSAEEWDAVFDPDSWITGDALLDRVERDLSASVANRDVFARIERYDDPGRVIAYSDEGYAVVYGDGTVEGTGTVLRDVKPCVALCSMESYDVPEMPSGDLLPRPEEVPEGGGDLGHRVMQAVAVIQLVAGVGLLVWAGWAAVSGTGGGRFGNPASPVLGVVAGIAFIGIALVFFLVVANARLSDRFRAAEYRERLRAVGIDSDDPPEFLLAAIDDHPELAASLDGADAAAAGDATDSGADQG